MQPSRFPVLWFLMLTYVLQGVGHWVYFLVSRRIVAGAPAGTPIDAHLLRAWTTYAFYIINVGPSLAGLLLTLFLYGFPGLRRLAFQLSPWSVGGAWLLLAVCLLVVLPLPGIFVLLSFVGLLIALYLHGPRRWLLGQGWPMLAICLLFPLGLVALSGIILTVLGGSVPSPSWQWSKYLCGAVIGGGFLGPGLCEEIGWRGFALPHLQRRYSALASSLIIGLAWGFWHWPNYLIPADSHWWLLLALVPTALATSVVFTWVYNSTSGSLFAVVLLHGAIYSVSVFFPPTPDPGFSVRTEAVCLLTSAVICVGLVWRYGAANLSLRERVVAHPPNTCVSPSGESGGI
ncbi:MAG: CPBP family intramembrane glutamic endopeptidase [Thermoguttaceae bacterium]